jgi:hypothetical protein
MTIEKDLICPRCSGSFLASQDLCLKCHFDLRWHKRSLGIATSHQGRSYEELLVLLVSPETSLGDEVDFQIEQEAQQTELFTIEVPDIPPSKTSAPRSTQPAQQIFEGKLPDQIEAVQSTERQPSLFSHPLPQRD